MYPILPSGASSKAGVAEHPACIRAGGAGGKAGVSAADPRDDGDRRRAFALSLPAVAPRPGQDGSRPAAPQSSSQGPVVPTVAQAARLCYKSPWGKRFVIAPRRGLAILSRRRSPSARPDRCRRVSLPRPPGQQPSFHHRTVGTTLVVAQIAASSRYDGDCRSATTAVALSLDLTEERSIP